MSRNPRRQIPRLACASILASALAFSIAAPVAQAAPQAPAQTTASKTTTSVPSDRWCDRNSRNCGGRGKVVCKTTKERVYNSRTRTWVYTYREVCTRRGW